MSDDTLPTGSLLADALYAVGLVPPGRIIALPWLRPESGLGRSELWEPHRRIEHCWYLVEQFKLSIEFSHRRCSWWVGEPAQVGMVIATFDEVPSAVCQAALKVLAWRNG